MRKLLLSQLNTHGSFTVAAVFWRRIENRYLIRVLVYRRSPWGGLLYEQPWWSCDFVIPLEKLALTVPLSLWYVEYFILEGC